jgi:hypothetical protein
VIYEKAKVDRLRVPIFEIGSLRMRYTRTQKTSEQEYAIEGSPILTTWRISYLISGVGGWYFVGCNCTYVLPNLCVFVGNSRQSRRLCGAAGILKMI